MLGKGPQNKWVKWKWLLKKKWVSWLLKKLLYRKEMRYEVRATNAEGKDIVVGWSSLRSGGTPMRIVMEHPEWHSPIIIDTKSLEGVLGLDTPREWDDGHGDSWPPTY